MSKDPKDRAFLIDDDSPSPRYVRLLSGLLLEPITVEKTINQKHQFFSSNIKGVIQSVLKKKDWT